MRLLVLSTLLLSSLACGPAGSTCSYNGKVTGVDITIDGVKEPRGTGDCADGTNSNIVITIGGTQKLVVQLGIGADATGTILCSGDNGTAQLDGSGPAFKPTAEFSFVNFGAGGNKPSGTSCTIQWSGRPAGGGKSSGSFTGRLAKPDHTEMGNTVYKYADVAFAFSFEHTY